jgi:serine/threonine-protein phosphatase 6 regulatory subunit 3
MSFWRTFGFHNANSIETILDRGDYTLDELLEEEEILQECKAQNKRLLDLYPFLLDCVFFSNFL